MLRLLERSRLSPTELRILLAVRDGEVAVSELAERFGRRSVEIRRAAARLYASGLLHWRHDRARDEPALAITPAGTMTVRPILTADSPRGTGALTAERGEPRCERLPDS